MRVVIFAPDTIEVIVPIPHSTTPPLTSPDKGEDQNNSDNNAFHRRQDQLKDRLLRPAGQAAARGEEHGNQLRLQTHHLWRELDRAEPTGGPGLVR